jgi:streptogrisin C
MSHSFRRRLSVLVGILVAGLAVTPVLSAQAEPTVDRERVTSLPADGLSAEVAAAVRRDLGLLPDQYVRLVAKQGAALELDGVLRSRLGNQFGGSWFDAAAGKLVVGVTDAERVAEVRSAGAEVRVVRHSMDALDAIKSQLDEASGVAGDRRTWTGGDGKATNRPTIAGLTSWRVDPISNSVVLTVHKGQTRAANELLAKYGDAVRIEESDRIPSTAANFMDGGDSINVAGLGCSAGFNARSTSGQGYLFTAGHCHRLGSGNAVYGQDGAYFGAVVESWFPGFDDALIRNDNPSYWIQGPWVDNNPGNGPVHIVRGWRDSLVGAAICKSGDTTKVSCGYIDGKGETVDYAEGTVYGLTRHSACVELGDSGGANFSGWGDVYAEGITSGADLYWDGSRFRCLAGQGLHNVSWYQPIASTLSWYGPRYSLSLWL